MSFLLVIAVVQRYWWDGYSATILRCSDLTNYLPEHLVNGGDVRCRIDRNTGMLEHLLTSSRDEFFVQPGPGTFGKHAEHGFGRPD
jgi:hypothetical protein